MKFKALSIVALFAFIAVAAILLWPRISRAQPYYTNTLGQAPGAWQYNQAYPTPFKPSQTVANQYAAGTLAGVGVTSVDGTVTNAFGTNIYSLPPIVVCTQSGLVITPTNQVLAVTTSNFIYNAGKSGVTNQWEATGH